jgi:hypothetical protein
MTINLQLIMKNHPVIRIRISKTKIAKPNVRLIMIESKSPKQILMSDHLGNILVCVITTHYFFWLFTLVLSCLYFLCEWNYFGLDLPTPGYYCKRLPILIHMHIRDTYKACVGCCKGAMLTPGFFLFFSITRVE